MFESAYLNPFGKPLFIATIDSSTGAPNGFLSIVATYKSQTNEWGGVQVGGTISDRGGVVGSFALTSSLVEHLLSGTEDDTGQQMALSFSPF